MKIEIFFAAKTFVPPSLSPQHFPMSALRFSLPFFLPFPRFISQTPVQNQSPPSLRSSPPCHPSLSCSVRRRRVVGGVGGSGGRGIFFRAIFEDSVFLRNKTNFCAL